MNESSPHELCPQPVRDVDVELPVGAVRREFRQLRAAAVLGNGPHVGGRGDGVVLALSEAGFVEFVLAGQAWSRLTGISGEDRLVAGIAVRSLGEERLFLSGIGEQRRPLEEGVHPVIVGLKIVIDERMVVTLSTLQIHPEEHASRVSGEQVRFGRAVHHELGGGTESRIDAIG